MPRFRFDYGITVLVGSPPPIDGGRESYAPRRMILDTILVEAAARAGAEVRPAFTVDGMLTDGEEVVGIRGHARGGGTLTERARLVVGADGRRSLVARAVAAPAYRSRPALTCAYYSYWSDVPAGEEIEGYFLPRRVILVFPTNDGQVCVFLQRRNGRAVGWLPCLSRRSVIPGTIFVHARPTLLHARVGERTQP